MKNWRNHIDEATLTQEEIEMMNWYDEEWDSFDDEYDPVSQLENHRIEIERHN